MASIVIVVSKLLETPFENERQGTSLLVSAATSQTGCLNGRPKEVRGLYTGRMVSVRAGVVYTCRSRTGRWPIS